jgi:hypothetical protein
LTKEHFMKSFKKFAASLAVGAAMAGASASASAAVSLIFYDEFFQEIGKVDNNLGGNSVGFNGNILGWNVTAVGGITYQPDGITRLELSGTTAIRKAGSFKCQISGGGGLINDGAGDPWGVAITLGTSYANSTACNATQAAAGGYTNNVLRIRVQETSFAVPSPNPAKLVYSLTSSLVSPPGGTVGGTVITGFDGLNNTAATTFGPIALSNANSLGGNFDSVTVASPNLFVQAGLDLIAGVSGRDANAMAAGSGFQWNMDLRSVPEPGTLALLGVSLLGIAALRRRSVSLQA